MTRTQDLILTIAICTLLSLTAGCLGERYEKNVPAADLELWGDSDGKSSGAADGRPRFVGPGTGNIDNGNINRGTMDRGTVGRGTLQRGTQRRPRLNRGTLDRGTR